MSEKTSEHPKPPDIVERLSDMDLEALAFTYEQNPSMIFSAQVVECLRELQRLRSPVPAEDSEGVRYRCERCGKNEREASATRCERSPCPMELISGADQ